MYVYVVIQSYHPPHSPGPSTGRRSRVTWFLGAGPGKEHLVEIPGDLTICYGKWWFSMEFIMGYSGDTFIISHGHGKWGIYRWFMMIDQLKMVVFSLIFHSYVKWPEGKCWVCSSGCNLDLLKIMFYFPNGKSICWGISCFLFFRGSLSKSISKFL